MSDSLLNIGVALVHETTTVHAFKNVYSPAGRRKRTSRQNSMVNVTTGEIYKKL